MIADREPLAWILTDERMAFPRHYELVEDDRLFLYTTRGCFRSPGRDRGRLVGEARVTRSLKPLPQPVVFGDRAFPFGCDLRITGLVSRGTGPELRDMVGRLHLFPDPQTWSARLRRVLVALDTHDAALLHNELAPLMQELLVNRDGYIKQSHSESRNANKFAKRNVS